MPPRRKVLAAPTRPAGASLATTETTTSSFFFRPQTITHCCCTCASSAGSSARRTSYGIACHADQSSKFCTSHDVCTDFLYFYVILPPPLILRSLVRSSASKLPNVRAVVACGITNLAAIPLWPGRACHVRYMLHHSTPPVSPRSYHPPHRKHAPVGK